MPKHEKTPSPDSQVKVIPQQGSNPGFRNQEDRTIINYRGRDRDHREFGTNLTTLLGKDVGQLPFRGREVIHVNVLEVVIGTVLILAALRSLLR